MNAAAILTDDMSLDEKLAAIDQAMTEQTAIIKQNNPDAPVDPATLTICDGCE